jgi:hypothetical protein
VETFGIEIRHLLLNFGQIDPGCCIPQRNIVPSPIESRELFQKSFSNRIEGNFSKLRWSAIGIYVSYTFNKVLGCR